MKLDVENVRSCTAVLHRGYTKPEIRGKKKAKYDEEFLKEAFEKHQYEASLLFSYIINMKINVYGYIYSNNDYIFSDIVFDVMKKTILGFDEEKGGNFDGFVRRIFKLSLLSVIKKENDDAEKLCFIDEPQYDKNNNETTIQLEDKSTDYSPGDAAEKNEERACKTNTLEELYLLFADITNCRIKQYEGRKTYCYAPLFFTDHMYILMNSGIDVETLLRNHIAALDNATSFRFADYFTTKKCITVRDLHNAKYKQLSDITGKDADKGKPCGNIENIQSNMVSLHYNVYTSFVSKETGKNISKSAITQQLDNFRNLCTENDDFKILQERFNMCKESSAV